MSESKANESGAPPGSTLECPNCRDATRRARDAEAASEQWAKRYWRDRNAAEQRASKTRAALERIARLTPDPTSVGRNTVGIDAVMQIRKARGIARRALAGACAAEPARDDASLAQKDPNV
jgi:hypothetical protein